jgi:fructuronate reductase
VNTRLSLAQWAVIPAEAKPPLDPRDLSVGIVHLGLGAFHRAHQAVYTQAAMVAASDTSWGICGVSQRSRDVVDALAPQDGLYTLASRGAVTSFAVLAPLRELLFAGDGQAALIARLSASTTKVVTVTVTEKGYRHDPATGRLNVHDTDIEADADGRPPVTVVGQLVRGLQARLGDDAGPLTVVSCDNLSHNGATLHGLVADFCALLPAAEQTPLDAWIAENVGFPSTVVDRIVPATTAADRDEVASYLGLDDQGAVGTEPFSQWVIEDSFVAARPAWELAGATFTADVAPYEALKLRLLNGSHSALAYLGSLAGYDYVADFVEVDGVGEYLYALMEEAASTIELPAGLEVGAYERQLFKRFGNPGLQHRLAQIATDGSQKLPQRLVAPVRELRGAGLSVNRSALAVAAWMRYVSASHDDLGRPIHVSDPLSERFAERLGRADTPAAVVDRLLGLREMFGDLGDDLALRQTLTDLLEKLGKVGALVTLRGGAASF